MRESPSQYRPRFLLCIFLGILINIVVAYSCGWRAGALGFSMADGAYGDWTHFVEFEDGWSVDGKTFGVSGRCEVLDIYDPPGMYSEDDRLSPEGGTVQTTQKLENRIGWPLRCIQYSQTLHEAMTIGPRVENQRRSVSKQKTDQTPTPHWYYKGIQTNLNNSVLSWIPVQIRPIGFFLNVVFYSIIVYAIRFVIVRLKEHRRLRMGLCVVCGYAAEGLAICPECGLEMKNRVV